MRKPYRSVRLIQTKWNGIVSQLGQKLIARKFAIANAPHAASGQLRRSKSITGMADGLDRCVGAEFFAQSADTDVDDIRAWIEVIAPDLRQQAFTADDLAGMLGEMMENAKLAV